MGKSITEYHFGNDRADAVKGPVNPAHSYSRLHTSRKIADETEKAKKKLKKLNKDDEEENGDDVKDELETLNQEFTTFKKEIKEYYGGLDKSYGNLSTGSATSLGAMPTAKLNQLIAQAKDEYEENKKKLGEAEAERILQKKLKSIGVRYELP